MLEPLFSSSKSTVSLLLFHKGTQGNSGGNNLNYTFDLVFPNCVSCPSNIPVVSVSILDSFKLILIFFQTNSKYIQIYKYQYRYRVRWLTSVTVRTKHCGLQPLETITASLCQVKKKFIKLLLKIELQQLPKGPNAHI